MMAKFSGDTRYCILTENSPAAAANELNRLLFAAGIEEKFITLSLSVLDLERRHLTLTSAGHLPLLIRRANGPVEEVGEDIAGFPLGIIPDVGLPAGRGHAQPRRRGRDLLRRRDRRRGTCARSSTTRATTAAC